MAKSKRRGRAKFRTKINVASRGDFKFTANFALNIIET